MTVAMLCLMFFGEMVPIKVRVGDPVINLPITSLETGAETNLKDIIDEGFVFFLSPECDYCQKAMANLSPIEDEFSTIMIFVGEEKDIRLFLNKYKRDIGTAFLVNEKHLLPHGLVTFPAVLTYHDGKNRVAMHGPMTPTNLRRLVLFHKRGYSIRKVNE